MTAKILVVDDELPIERLICQQFRKKIRAKELEFVFAHNGVEALDKLQNNPQIDMVLTDINMPEMDGLTLLEKLKEIEPSLKTVVVSAYSDMANIRKAMNHDAFDFLTKPIDFQDLEVTINRTLGYVQELKETQRQFQQVQTRLIQKEKMSALGQLVAGVAHEINNPVGFIAGNLTHAQSYINDILNLLHLYQQHYPNPVSDIQEEIEQIDLDYLVEDLPQLISSMKVGVERINQISVSLRNFSRSDTSSKVLANIHEGIESTLLILRHRLKASAARPAIEVVKDYGDLPQVECYPGPLNQVFMNILANAIDALEEAMLKEKTERSPTIKICTEVLEGDFVEIRIADNGVGMTEDVQKQLFEPMFTTKATNKGTGLGLSISRQIMVEKHKGQLTCSSKLGWGTEFIIKMPIRQIKKV
ncbi:response regulator [Microcoleus sp. FACHB-831]|uniref:hybrid sensor histidine kinase/response regulator n=1 Tax=Microcoleus sp. FACHB-831 TaxID=2692827 RepID=UPI001682BA3A|nr:response regulator [Microcoleus sp. FACHB-831]MBD1923021.1 response regulator [Microcoleus sp. FACHB-831]